MDEPKDKDVIDFAIKNSKQIFAEQSKFFAELKRRCNKD